MFQPTRVPLHAFSDDVFLAAHVREGPPGAAPVAMESLVALQYVDDVAKAQARLRAGRGLEVGWSGGGPPRGGDRGAAPGRGWGWGSRGQPGPGAAQRG